MRAQETVTLRTIAIMEGDGVRYGDALLLAYSNNAEMLRRTGRDAEAAKIEAREDALNARLRGWPRS